MGHSIEGLSNTFEGHGV